VFQKTGEARPSLYVSTISNWGSILLRSQDGSHFREVSEPGLGDDQLLSFRALVPFRDKLFTTPVGSITQSSLDRNSSSRPLVFVSETPAEDRWLEASDLGFGNPNNGVIFQMAAFGDYLYAGTGNAETGFELWKTDAEGKPPYRWQPVIVDGAERYNLNESIASMVVFQDALYIGTGIPGLGYDKANDVGPGAAELIRVFPDDTWELVVGTPRFSPAGLQVPLSLAGPGFDDPHNSVFWRMAVHDGWLYLGTHHWGVYKTAVTTLSDTPAGGFQIWATPDGVDWHAMSKDGLGNPFSVGVRTLVSTPSGLVVGTDDHSIVMKNLIRRRNALMGLPGEEDQTSGFDLWVGDDPDRTAPPVIGGNG
jgi:hypothetical protein